MRPARRRRRSRRWACSRSSTGARSRPGIAVSDRDGVMVYKDLGLVSQVLDETHIASLQGDLAISHCRYSTTGSTLWENSQPTFRLGPRRTVAIGHNGNLVNTRALLEELPGGRSRLVGTTDTEVLTALLADEPGDRPGRGAREPAAAGPGRVLAGGHGRGPGHRGARPVRLPAARPGPAAARCRSSRTRPAPRPATRGGVRAAALGRRRARIAGRRRRAAVAGCWPRRRRRSTSWAPTTCATSSRARSWSWVSPAVRAPSASRRARNGCACSSSSTSRDRTPTCSAATCTRRGGGWARCWRARRPRRRTW